MQLVEISSASVAIKSIVQLTTAICKLEIVKCLTVHWPRLLSAIPTFTGLHMLQPDFKDNVRNNVLMDFSYSSFNHDVYLTWKLILKGFTAICVQYDHSVHNSVDKQLSMMAKLTISPPITLRFYTLTYWSIPRFLTFGCSGWVRPVCSCTLQTAAVWNRLMKKSVQALQQRQIYLNLKACTNCCVNCYKLQMVHSSSELANE